MASDFFAPLLHSRAVIWPCLLLLILPFATLELANLGLACLVISPDWARIGNPAASIISICLRWSVSLYSSLEPIKSSSKLLILGQLFVVFNSIVVLISRAVGLLA